MITITAHSGCMNTEENSVDSIITGIENGADIIEVDVRFDKNGEPVLSHNETDGACCVKLSEAFDIIRRYSHIRMNLDIKETDNLPLIEKTAREKGVIANVFFTGVNDDFILPVKTDCPSIPFYINVQYDEALKDDADNIARLIEKTKNAGAIGINPSFNLCSKKLTAAFRENKLLVSIWTARSEEEAAQCLSLEPDNITTTIPHIVRSMIGKD